MARRRKTSTFEDMVELASRLPWWVALTLAFVSYLLLHAYATSPLPALTDSRQMGQHLTSSAFRGLALAGQYFLPAVFVFGAVGSVFARYHRRKLHERVVSATRPGQIIDGLSWQEFELLIGEVFRKKGYSVLERGGAGPDGGVDLVLHKNGDKYLVQCKHWRSMKVGVSVAREFLGAMAVEGAVGGFIVTSGSMTDEGRDFSRGRNIEIVEGGELNKWLAALRGASALRGGAKVALAQERAAPFCPVCKNKMVLRVAKRGANAGGQFWGCRSYPACRGTVSRL